MSNTSDVTLKWRYHFINLFSINIICILRRFFIFFSYLKLTWFFKSFSFSLHCHCLLRGIIKNIIRHWLREICNSIRIGSALHFSYHLILCFWIIFNSEKLHHWIKIGSSSIRPKCNWKLSLSLWFNPLCLWIDIKHRLFIWIIRFLDSPNNSDFTW